MSWLTSILTPPRQIQESFAGRDPTGDTRRFWRILNRLRIPSLNFS